MRAFTDTPPQRSRCLEPDARRPTPTNPNPIHPDESLSDVSALPRENSTHPTVPASACSSFQTQTAVMVMGADIHKARRRTRVHTHTHTRTLGGESTSCGGCTCPTAISLQLHRPKSIKPSCGDLPARQRSSPMCMCPLP